MTGTSDRPNGKGTPIVGPHAAGAFLSVFSFRGGRPLIYFGGAAAIIVALIGAQHLLASDPNLVMSAPPDYCAIEADDATVGRYRRNAETALELETRSSHDPIAMMQRPPITYELVGLYTGCHPLAALRAGEDVALRPWLSVTAMRTKLSDVPVKVQRAELLEAMAAQYSQLVGQWRWEDASAEDRAAGRGEQLAYVVVAVDSDDTALYLIEEERDPVDQELVLDVATVALTAVRGVTVRVDLVFDPADGLAHDQLFAELKDVVRQLLDDNGDL